MLRLIILSLFFLPPVFADEEEEREQGKSCHMHKTWPIHFRNFEEKDVLELSVAPGPCETTLMTLIIRSQDGEIFYLYAGRFATHVTFDPEDPNFHKFVGPYLAQLESHAQKNTKMLPKYYKQDAANGLIKLHVSTKAYKTLRVRHLPLFYHLNQHDRWQYVLYDNKKRRAKLIASGQVGALQ